MPSNSNKNKLSLPPYPPAVETVCIPVTVPNDPQWIGLFLGALYRLTQQVWYDRDEAHTARLVAAVWQDIYLETVKAIWDCEGSVFDLRVSPTDNCLIEKTTDGETWVDAFRLDTDCALTRIIRNPYNGRLGFEVEDVGFYEFPDGPWGESLYPDFTVVGPPVIGADKVCVAAYTAAYVLSNLYTDVANGLLNAVANTDWEYAGALGSILQGFLLVIGAVAVQPFVALSTLLGIVGVKQQYVDYPLDAADKDRLMCILRENITIDAGGSAVVDFDAVYAAIDLDSPKNGLVRFLLTMIGPDALNFAAGVDAGFASSADCSVCDGEWCYEFDFTVDQQGFAGVGVYESGLYWRGQGLANFIQLRVSRGFGGVRTITGVEIDFNSSEAAVDGDGGLVVLLNGSTVVYQTPKTMNQCDDSGGWVTRVYSDLDVSADSVRIGIDALYAGYGCGASNGHIQISRLLLRGYGVNPFGVDNCST